MSTIEDKLASAQESLNNFELIHNLKPVQIPNEIDEIMGLTYERLAKLDAVTCAEYAYLLSQYSLYIQKTYNSENATLKWLNNELQTIICDKLEHYDKYMKYEIKIKLIGRENEVVNKINRLVNFTEQKLIRLEFVATSIKNLADNLINIQRAKSFQTRGEYGR